MMDDTPPGNGPVDTTAYAVLYLLRDREDIETVRDFTKQTDLTKDQVNGAFKRLADAGYITVEKPTGRTTEWIDGRKVSYPKPKEATLTDTGIAYVDWATRHTAPPDMTVGDNLQDRLSQLEDRVDELEVHVEKRIHQLRDQVLDALDDQ